MVDADKIINTVVGGVVAIKVLETGGKMLTGATRKTKNPFKIKKKGGLHI